MSEAEAERKLERVKEAVDALEIALARYFAGKDVPMEIRQAVDAYEIALAGSEEYVPPRHRQVMSEALAGSREEQAWTCGHCGHENHHPGVICDSCSKYGQPSREKQP